MSTVFVGGSRHVARLPSIVTDRLRKMIDNKCKIIVGDANGVDKAVQTFFHQAGYQEVTVFCSGTKPRNNWGNWRTHPVPAPPGTKGFQFYAIKDRAMASVADVGCMVWDGKSPGTVLNLLRLIQAHKKAVLINVPAQTTTNIRSEADWAVFLSTCNEDLRRDLWSRATPEEREAAASDGSALYGRHSLSPDQALQG